MEQVDQLNKKISQQNDKISELHVIIETLLRKDGKVCTLMYSRSQNNVNVVYCNYKILTVVTM